MNKLVVLGSVNADHVVKVPTFPRPGETLQGHNYQVIPGGKGANQALSAARLGGDIGFIASVGDDAFGRKMISEFTREGINTQCMFIEPDTPTGIAMIQVADTGENSICISAEANAKLNAQRLMPHLDMIKQADYLLLQLETPLEGVILAIEAAKSGNTQVVLNPAPAMSLTDDLLRRVDVITPNETEAEVLTGITVSDEISAQRAADSLLSKGIKLVIITLGAKGVWCSQQCGEGRLIGGYSVTAIDTTAAGDTFNGAFVTGLLEGLDIDNAIMLAHASAAISVTRFGAQTSIPLRKEVDHFMAEQG